MNLRKLLVCACIAFTSVMFAQNLNVTLRSNLTYPGKTCANITGYVDTAGNEYALVGVADGLSIVDVTNPTAPVEVKKIPNIDNLWKEVKVYGKYAYVTTEGGGGLQIVNMSTLPNAAGVVYRAYTGDGTIAGSLTTIHALHIDGHFAYIYGSNLFNGGAMALDLTDPWNPVYSGVYNIGTGQQPYVHDGYVRNDTLYAGHIYSGYFSVVDFTNKAAPVELANQFTPSNFTHNTWLSTNSRVLFTTDEVDNSYLTSYDVSDLSNITLLDKIQSNPGSQSIVHNTHIIRVAGNDYAVTSWYKDGFTIVDAGRPGNLVQVGNYDNYAPTGGGFEGTWGVYPYLPSGNIIASNMEDGLFVYTPTYQRACYIEGNVTDSVTGTAINGAMIQILSTAVSDYTNISGAYATGLASTGGVCSATFSKPGYFPKTITGITLTPAVVNLLNVELVPIPSITFSGQIVKAGSTVPVANAKVLVSNNDFTYQATTNASGNFTINGVYPDIYNITAGQWGYVTSCNPNVSVNSGSASMTIELASGYYDDFTFDFGWNVSGNASTGAWIRTTPIATFSGPSTANPDGDNALDCNDKAFVTGNGGGSAAADDVDGGATSLISPVFDLSGYVNPYVSFSRWFYAGGGTGSPNDSMKVILNNGLTNVVVDFARYTTIGNSSWLDKNILISSLITPTSTMKIIVRTADNTPGHLVEAGFDKFQVTEGPMGVADQAEAKTSLAVYPNPFDAETTIAYTLQNQPVSDAKIIITDITGRVIEMHGIDKQNGTMMFNSATAGIYIVTVMNGSESSSPLKIVKMK
ncbi:MAG: hypothetical protein K0Q95_2992 [Bacteroidota bacterium]|jgi:choice-of-anchor B domain-containing protein|nr:hypothetical protein [Bacteroidota bacterium]